MTSEDLVTVFSKTKETLFQSGIEDDFFLDLLTSRLLIERIGESGNLGWWDSRVLSETGRARLSEVTPKTVLKSRVNLALKVGRKAESDRLPDDSISLFYFGPQMEARLDAAIEEMAEGGDTTLMSLENLSLQSLTDDWTNEIIEQTEANISGGFKIDTLESQEAESTFLIGEEGYNQEEIEHEKWRLLTTVLHGYGQCNDRLQVPYYPLESNLKAENA